VSQVISAVNTLFGYPGRLVLSRLMYAVKLSTFSMLALRDWYRHNRIFSRRSYRNVIAQIIFTGVDALPTITMLGLATSFIFTFRLIAIVDSIGGTEDLVDVLTNVIGLEIGPLIAAIILISRTGSAIVIDLGNMKLHREIEGLELLAVNINDYLIAPRLLGAAISQLAITVYFTLITMVVGILLSGLLLNVSHFDLLISLSTVFSLPLLGAFVIKNMLFGFMIAATACYHGMRVRTSPTEVPQQAQRAIVNSLIMLFIIDGLLGLALLS
jgi:phospholipid/cholesterol/gamma-HCH transport system permease protein